MTQPIDERVKTIVASVVRVPVADMAPDASSATLPGWDSLNHMKIVLAIEEEFGVMLDERQIRTTTSLPALIGELKKLMSV